MDNEQQPQPEQRQRCTKAQLQERQEKACDLLAEGWPSHAVVKQLSTEYNVTEQQARIGTTLKEKRTNTKPK